MIKYNELDGTNIAEIIVDGKVTKEDLDSIIPRIEQLIERHGSVRLMEVIESFGGFELSMLWDDMKFAFGHMKDFQRVAVVTDKRWIKNWSKVGTIFLGAELEIFDLDQIEEARAWLAKDTPKT